MDDHEPLHLHPHPHHHLLDPHHRLHPPKPWGNHFISATKTQRYRTIQRIYVQCRMERARTMIIGKDERFIVGDGAWHTVRAQYPEGV